MYICLCIGITDAQIHQAIEEGAQSVKAIANILGAGTQCGQCRVEIERMIITRLSIIDPDKLANFSSNHPEQPEPSSY